MFDLLLPSASVVNYCWRCDACIASSRRGGNTTQRLRCVQLQVLSCLVVTFGSQLTGRVLLGVYVPDVTQRDMISRIHGKLEINILPRRTPFGQFSGNKVHDLEDLHERPLGYFRLWEWRCRVFRCCGTVSARISIQGRPKCTYKQWPCKRCMPAGRNAC